MITSVRVYDELRLSSVKLPVYSPSVDIPYYVKEITGLGPVKADIATSTFASVDGGVVHSTRAGMRNVVMTIGYSPYRSAGQTTEALRRELYSVMPPKGRVRLVINNNEFEAANIYGYVESHEPMLFTKDPEVVISILCELPYFKAPKSITLQGEMGVPLDTIGVTDVETGFVFNFRAIRYTEAIRIRNELHTDLLYMKPLEVGDRLKVSTVPGNKFFNRDDGRGYYSDFDGLVQGDMAMTIGPNIRNLIVTAQAHDDQGYNVEITPLYVGM